MKWTQHVRTFFKNWKGYGAGRRHRRGRLRKGAPRLRRKWPGLGQCVDENVEEPPEAMIFVYMASVDWVLESGALRGP